MVDTGRKTVLIVGKDAMCGLLSAVVAPTGRKTTEVRRAAQAVAAILTAGTRGGPGPRDRSPRSG